MKPCFFLIFFTLVSCATRISRGPTQSADYQETAVEIAASGITLHGTFTTPVGGARSIGVLLISGSGPTDREGNQPGLTTNLHQQLARGLAGLGVSSLRFDKRSVRSYAPLWPKSLHELNAFMSFDNFISDARSAFRVLQGMPGIAYDQCSVAGHSEGGLIASALSRSEKIKSLVLLSTPGRTLAAVLRSQLETLLTSQGAADQVRSFMLGEHDRIVSSIVTTGTLPSNIPPGLAAFYPPSAVVYLQRALAYAPEEDLKNFMGPVLVMNGGNDSQISPTLDAEALFRGLTLRRNAIQKLKILKGVSHNYKPVSSVSDRGFEGDIPAEAIDEIRAWVQ